MLKASADELEIVTVLGTCISVCLYDNITKIGGLNHFLLPKWEGQGLRTPRYGDVAIEQLIRDLEELGAVRRRLKAKVFGGMVNKHRNLEYSIGVKNIEFVFQRLKELDIEILSYDVGENFTRKILMNTKTGGVKLKRIKND